VLLTESLNLSIEDIDFDFENTTVRIVAVRKLHKITIAGVAVGPLEEGKEFEIKNWIASKLVKSGYAKYQGEYTMDVVALNKIHWRETKLQTGRRISSLPEFFYPKLRRYLGELKEKAVKDASFTIEYDRASKLARDVINCRLKKIVSLSASPQQTVSVLRSLSKEERILYEDLRSKVLEWDSKILRVGIFK
jgi:hypothetical protein